MVFMLWWDRSFPFRKTSDAISATLSFSRQFLNYQQIFLHYIKQKGKYVNNHPFITRLRQSEDQ